MWGLEAEGSHTPTDAQCPPIPPLPGKPGLQRIIESDQSELAAWVLFCCGVRTLLAERAICKVLQCGQRPPLPCSSKIMLCFSSKLCSGMADHP